MKTQFVAFALLLLTLAACTGIDSSSFEKDSFKQPSYNVSLSEISRIDFSKMVSPQTKTAGALSKEITPIVEGKDTLLYIINYGKDEGWVLASADKRAPVVNAISETGRFDLSEAYKNKSLMVWLNMVQDNIRYLKQNPEIIPDSTALGFWTIPEQFVHTKGGEGEHEGEWLQLVYTAIGTDCRYDIGHLMATQWGPGSPWNSCLPFDGNGNRCETSLSVVATAQLAYYHHNLSGKPQSAYAYGTCTNHWYQTSDLQLYNKSSANWSLMPYSSGSSAESGKQAVAALMAEIGQEAETVYNPSGTVSSYSGCMNYLADNGINSSYSGYYDNDTILSNLQQGWPVYVMFSPDSGCSYDAVVDGMMVYAQRSTYYYQWMPIGTYPPTEPEYPDMEHLELYEIYDYWGPNTNYWSLVNWGLDGAYNNAMFNISVPAGVPSVFSTPSSVTVFVNIH